MVSARVHHLISTLCWGMVLVSGLVSFITTIEKLKDLATNPSFCLGGASAESNTNNIK